MLSDDTSKIKSRKTRVRTPKHPVVTRAYRFPMAVSATQSAKLFSVLRCCLELRNLLVSDRIDNRAIVKEAKQSGVKPEDYHYLNRADQYKAVSLYSKQNPILSKIHSQVKQNIAHRVDEGYKRWFEALKEGRNGVKPPKVIEDLKKYRSFTYPQYGNGTHIRNGKVFLSGLGAFSINGYRKIRGLKKTVTIKWCQGKWWCVVTVAIQEKDQVVLLPLAGTATLSLDAGCDPGLTTLLTDSHGNKYDPPRAYQEGLKELRSAQRNLSRKFESRKKSHQDVVAKAKATGAATPVLKETPYSNRLQAQIRKVAKLHTRFENVRDHHQKKIASILASKYRRVAVEEHGVQFMIRDRKTAKSALDRAITKQKQLLRSKLGPRYHEAATSRPWIGGNSQSCVCGASVPKDLGQRVHRCPECDLVADRDHVSANIVQLIAFGTISDTLGYQGPEPGRYAGSISSGVEGSKLEVAKANPASHKALETPKKRHLSASCRKSSTVGGEPTAEGKNSEHRTRATKSVGACA